MTQSDHFRNMVDRTVNFVNDSFLFSTTMLEFADKILTAYDPDYKSFGVEHVTTCGRHLYYLNQGDTYAYTVLKESGCKLTAGSWGDWVEQVELEYALEHNEIRCGNCGEWTPNDQDDWHDVVCISCHRNVDGS